MHSQGPTLSSTADGNQLNIQTKFSLRIVTCTETIQRLPEMGTLNNSFIFF